MNKAITFMTFFTGHTRAAPIPEVSCGPCPGQVCVRVQQGNLYLTHEDAAMVAQTMQALVEDYARMQTAELAVAPDPEDAPASYADIRGGATVGGAA